MKLHDYITVLPGMPDDICEDVIRLFENHEEHHIRRDKDGMQNFTELNIAQAFPELNAILAKRIKFIREDYMDHTPQDPIFPWMWGLEEFRIKRYNEGDCFKQHVDVGDLNSARRFLAFLFYLNDDFEGGGTMFRTPDIKYIKPEKGRVLVFPPTWQYPHEGLPVKKGTKYILSTYLHYVAPPPGVHSPSIPDYQ